MTVIVLFLLAEIALAVVLLRAIAPVRMLRRRGTNAEEALQRMEALGGSVSVADARAIDRIAPGSVAAVLLAGMSQPDEVGAEAAVRRHQAEELGRYDRDLAAIERAGAGALLVPAAFGVWLLRAGPGPALGGWLHLAAIGLGIAIAATLVRAWILTRLRRLALDMEKAAAVVYNTAR